MRHVSRSLHLRRVVVRHAIEGLHGAVDLLQALQLGLGTSADVLNLRTDALHGLHHFFNGARRLAHALVAFGHARAGLANQGADLFGSLSAALRQGAHFAGHHSKTFALLASARGFHGGIQGQQIGLESNAFNGANDLAHARGRLADAVHGTPHLGNGGTATPGSIGAVRAFLGHGSGGLHGVAHTGIKVQQRLAGLVQVVGLGLGALRQLGTALGDLPGHAGKAMDFATHIAQHSAQIELNLYQAAHHHTQSGGKVGARAGSEVATREVAGKAFGLFQGGDKVVAAIQHHARAHQHQCHHTPGQRLPALQAQHIGHQHAGGECPHRQGHAHRQAQRTRSLKPAPRAGVEQPPLAQKHAGAALLGLAAHLGEQGLGLLNFLRRGLGAHRQVAHRFVPLQNGRDVGTHPVVVTVFAPVFHQPGPRLAPPHGGPHVFECCCWHVRVANDVVWLADQLLVAVTTDAHKRRIAVGNFSPGVGTGNQKLIAGVVVVVLGDGQVDFHGYVSR